MNKLLNNFLQLAKKIIETFSSLMKNKWLQAALTIFVSIYAIYFLHSQYKNIQSAMLGLKINLTYLLISSIVSLITFLLSIFSWKFYVDAYGYSIKWISTAHTQMMSSIGKYIPGKIWNYSSKVYFSNQLGIPIKVASMAYVTEMASSYLLAFSLSLLFFPLTIFPNTNPVLKVIINLLGGFLLGLIIFSPTILKKLNLGQQYVQNTRSLTMGIFIRLAIWLLSGLAFLLLVNSLEYPRIHLSTCINTVTSSFLIGFLAFFLPDGIVVRETIIISILQPYLTTPNAIVLSTLYRFQLVIVEFMTILAVYIIWKIDNKRMANRGSRER